MERIFAKFVNKYWWVGNRSEMALIILKQIVDDIRKYISSHVEEEMVNINLYPKLKPQRRSQSCPNLPAMSSLYGTSRSV